MKMKYGAIVVDGRGKLGGNVVQKNNQVISMRSKSKTKPTLSKFQRQMVANYWRSISFFYAQSTEFQKQWREQAFNGASTNAFGDLITPTGANWFASRAKYLFYVEGNPAALSPAPDSKHTSFTPYLTEEPPRNYIFLNVPDPEVSGIQFWQIKGGFYDYRGRETSIHRTPTIDIFNVPPVPFVFNLFNIFSTFFGGPYDKDTSFLWVRAIYTDFTQGRWIYYPPFNEIP